MAYGIEDIAKSAVGPLVGAGLGIATAEWQDKRQLNQQRKLNEIEMQNSKEMQKYNQGLGLETWEKTGAKAQVKQLKDAGLNVGLMYEGGGTGGTLSNPQGSVSGGKAEGSSGEIGLGIQNGLAAQQMQAQIALTKAQENLVNTQANKMSGADTENTQADTEKAKVDTELGRLDSELKKIQIEQGSRSLEDNLRLIEAAADKARGEATSATAGGKVDQATTEEKIKQINLKTTQDALTIAATKQGIKASQAQIDKIAAEIAFMDETKRKQWREWTQAEQEIWIKKQLMTQGGKQTEFNTSEAAQLGQWTQAIGNILKIHIK